MPTAQIHVRLVYGLMYVSLAALVAGTVALLVSSIKAKQQTMKTPAATVSNAGLIKPLLVKTLVFSVAFVVGGSIANVVVTGIVPILLPSKSTGEQGHIFAYLTIVLYPTAGALATYLTSRWLKKKQR